MQEDMFPDVRTSLEAIGSSDRTNMSTGYVKKPNQVIQTNVHRSPSRPSGTLQDAMTLSDMVR